MSTTLNQPLPTTGRLLRSTALAAVVAGALLVTTVLPAEYGIDPTGIGRALGLTALADTDSRDVEALAAPVNTSNADAVAALAEKAKAAFGTNKGQSLDPGAVAFASGPTQQHTLTLELPPGKGAEVKSHMVSGASLLFRWRASGDVAVDMHGERPDVKGAWTSYAVESAQRAAEGAFIAPFDGTHGWYWLNRGTEPVTVTVEVTGFQADLYQP